ncbi:MAG: hypothetical protein CMJ78_25535, partial [Planctomycetaceae bacterium]|nr:hypothetical protein [Planctomycetaceae bacterium]
NVGDEVEVSYRLSGRKWQRDPSSEVKYFLSAEVLSFQILNSVGGGESSQEIPPELDGTVMEGDDEEFDMF